MAELAAAGGFVSAGDSEVKVIAGQWYSVFGAQPVQIVVARRAARDEGFDITLVSTDLRPPPPSCFG